MQLVNAIVYVAKDLDKPVRQLRQIIIAKTKWVEESNRKVGGSVCTSNLVQVHYAKQTFNNVVADGLDTAYFTQINSLLHVVYHEFIIACFKGLRIKTIFKLLNKFLDS